MTQSIQYWEQGHPATQPRLLRLIWDITGAVTVSPMQAGLPVLTTFGAIAAQATIDDYLETTNEFLIAAFDATAMGADSMGGIVRMAKQCKSVDYMIARCYSGTDGATLVEATSKSSAALTASTLNTEVAVGADGNIAFTVNWGNTPDFDALTAGQIVIDIMWHSK